MKFIRVHILIAMFLFSCLVITSCGNKQGILSKINIISTEAYYCVNTENCEINEDKSNDTSNINIFFYLKNNVSIDTLKKEITSIELISNKNFVSGTKINCIDSLTIQNKKLYYLGLCLNHNGKNKDFNFNKIRFNHNNAETCPIGNYYVSMEKLSQERELSIVESPIMPKTSPEINKDDMISYKIMTNQKMSQNPRFKVKIPFYNKNFIEIIDTKCKYDIDATNDARTFYLKLKSKKEIANLKVYNIDIKYSIRKKFNILFKPCISFSYNGTEKISSPAFPLVVFCNELG